MKLRILGNSLRLRLTRSEVARLGDGGRVEETIHFGANRNLVYRLEASSDEDAINADYQNDCITVRLPVGAAREWANSERISLGGEQRLDGGGAALKLLIEKDFACLTERRGADDADTFPHPMEGALRC
ncbi:MAG TPA: hypothetical protein VM943_09070 [Pyrinomonadaceae bacterium]|nr:hypothetical protein [Pyrinomonadaceae bacterium]